MGNSSTKERQPHGRSRPGSPRNLSTSDASPAAQLTDADRYLASLYGAGTRGPTGRSGSRSDLRFLHLGGGGNSDRDGANQEQRRETKQEREARKQAKDRAAREQERERSLREEHIDGGFLVTLGTYTGPEDFSKPIVRQLQVCLR